MSRTATARLETIERRLAMLDRAGPGLETVKADLRFLLRHALAAEAFVAKLSADADAVEESFTSKAYRRRFAAHVLRTASNELRAALDATAVLDLGGLQPGNPRVE